MQILNRIKSFFLRKWPPSNLFVNVTLGMCLFTLGLIVALKLSGSGATVSLTIFWVVVAISGILAAVTLVRINIEPKDNRLDTIIEILRDLVKSVDKLSNHIDILSDKIDKKESLDSNIQKSDNLGNKST